MNEREKLRIVLTKLVLVGSLTSLQMDRIMDEMAAGESLAPETRWFTFGFDHRHDLNGIILDRDIVLEVTDLDPWTVMMEKFGTEWGCDYSAKPDLEYYPRGVITLREVIAMQDINRVDRGELFI
jgi:hypothetical protein